MATSAKWAHTDRGKNLFTCHANLDFVDPVLRPILVFRIHTVVRLEKPAAQLHQRPRTETIESLLTLLKPPFINQRLQRFLRLQQCQTLSTAPLRGRSVLRFPSVFDWRFCQFHRLHRRNGTDFLPDGIVRFKHGVEQALEEAYLVCGMYGC